RDNGEHLDDLVDAVGGERVDGVAQALDDLFVVFERVPDLAQVVGDAAKVLVHLLVEEGARFALQAGDDRDERFDDTPEGYHVAADDGYLQHGLADPLLEYLVLHLLDVCVYLVEDGEAVINKRVYDQIEEVAGGAAHGLGPGRGVFLALLEESHERPERA